MNTYYQGWQPSYNYPEEPDESTTIGNWFGTILLTKIPVIGFIMLIVWTVSHKNNCKKNWAGASLILHILFTIANTAVFIWFIIYEVSPNV